MLRLPFVLFSLTLWGLLSAPVRAEQEPPAVRAFGWLDALEGEWRGEYTWSGARSGSGEITVRYQTISNGSAVLEHHYFDGDDPFMSSLFHLDGDDLRMTHYCAAANQPRFRAAEIDTETRRVRLDFVDVTNLRSPDAGHVHGVELEWTGDDRFEIRYHYLAGEERSLETIRLERRFPARTAIE